MRVASAFKYTDKIVYMNNPDIIHYMEESPMAVKVFFLILFRLDDARRYPSNRINMEHICKQLEIAPSTYRGHMKTLKDWGFLIAPEGSRGTYRINSRLCGLNIGTGNPRQGHETRI